MGSARIVSQIHDEIVVETPDIFQLFEQVFGMTIDRRNDK